MDRIKFNQLTELCRKCADECRTCAIHCNENPSMQECMVACNECADACELVIAEGENNRNVIELCADACTACAEVVEKYGSIYCQACADSCRECAEACSAASRESIN
jgi:hypothetical protein